MNQDSSQKQLKISLSSQLNSLLQQKAQSLGLPVTQFVKHIIIKEVEVHEPTFTASKRTELRTKKALNELDKADIVENIASYLNNL